MRSSERDFKTENLKAVWGGNDEPESRRLSAAGIMSLSDKVQSARAGCDLAVECGQRTLGTRRGTGRGEEEKLFGTCCRNVQKFSSACGCSLREKARNLLEVGAVEEA